MNPNIYLTDGHAGGIGFLPWDYGNTIPDLSEYDKIIMCDISFPKEEMFELYTDLGTNIIWIDHHISAIKDVNERLGADLFEGLRDTKFAACELTWKYFFPNEEMPEIVRLLGRYDCFGHKGTDEETKVLEFQYGARQVITNYEEAYSTLIESLTSPYENAWIVVDSIKNQGESIYQYLCTEAKQIYSKAFEIELIGGKESTVANTEKLFLCVNQERFNPINFGIDYHKDGYDGFACFHYKGGKWHFSLYNDNGEVDCSAIAKSFGGGGHKGAAGFVVDTETFNMIINQ